jgi:tRNA threonylcarbamoyladenosine biosynthesis protein TsaE
MQRQTCVSIGQAMVHVHGYRHTMMKKMIVLASEDDTALLGEALSEICAAGDLIALYGDLGAGKSALCRAFVRALTSEDQDVPSPTFTLVQSYETPEETVYHYDLYRLNKPDDVLELGMEEALEEGICLVEWPEKMGPYLPWDRIDLDITIQPDDKTRVATLAGIGAWSARLNDLRVDLPTEVLTDDPVH